MNAAGLSPGLHRLSIVCYRPGCLGPATKTARAVYFLKNAAVTIRIAINTLLGHYPLPGSVVSTPLSKMRVSGQPAAIATPRARGFGERPWRSMFGPAPLSSHPGATCRPGKRFWSRPSTRLPCRRRSACKGGAPLRSEGPGRCFFTSRPPAAGKPCLGGPFGVPGSTLGADGQTWTLAHRNVRAAPPCKPIYGLGMRRQAGRCGRDPPLATVTSLTFAIPFTART
jgi:hypothetical protein